jgi:hypothetical protein
MTDTLAAALPREMIRVAELMAEYHALGPPGAIASATMRAALDRACNALGDGDVVEMYRVYQRLREFER